MFQTEDEIARDIIATRLTDAARAEIMSLPPSDLGLQHHGFGTWIRNTYGLWQRPEWKPVIINGVDHAEDHPDAISMRIIRKIHTLLIELSNDP